MVEEKGVVGSVLEVDETVEDVEEEVKNVVEVVEEVEKNVVEIVGEVRKSGERVLESTWSLPSRLCCPGE